MKKPAIARRIADSRARAKRPKAVGQVPPKIVSLFSGAGGLDLGFKRAGFEIVLAIDANDAAIRTHGRNFPRTKSLVADLTKVGPVEVADHLRTVLPMGSRIGVIGGPPCQGFSRANTASRPNDSRNKLPATYLRIIAELQKHFVVEFVLFENVLGIRDQKHAVTYNAIVNGLEALGLSVTERELCALDFGVPQKRRRIVLTGMRKAQGYASLEPRRRKGLLTVKEAIGGLVAPAFHSFRLVTSDIPFHPNHWTMRPRSPRFSNPEKSKKEGRSFKRLEWSKASPTIAFGHREIHVHPSGKRRLSLYEAMRLQGFPHEFVLEGNLSEQVEQVSNAVPPPLARSVAHALRRSLVKE